MIFSGLESILNGRGDGAAHIQSPNDKLSSVSGPRLMVAADTLVYLHFFTRYILFVVLLLWHSKMFEINVIDQLQQLKTLWDPRKQLQKGRYDIFCKSCKISPNFLAFSALYPFNQISTPKIKQKQTTADKFVYNA